MSNLLIFEGISGAGKTTLFHPVHQLSNYADIQIHRFTPTHWVYNKLNKRHENINYEKINQLIQNILPTYIIWCVCSPEIALARQLQKKDNRIENLLIACKLYEEYFSKISTWNNVLKIDTERYSILECVSFIKEWIYP